MKEIKLANGKGIALVDDEDYERVSQYKWYLKNKNENYARGYINSNMIYMHRFILNPPEDINIDHINGVGLDNRKCNLRFATQSQNQWNRKKTNNRLGLKGVYFIKKKKLKKPWVSWICFNNRPKYLGYYSTAKEAALVYDKKARELFGEFAHTNFKEEK